jgi:hypothetical protein
MPRTCSYSYTPLDKILCCSRCSKHPYCSRECQAKDWKQHKLWCGCTAELDVDFEVRDAGEGRGLGIFALRAFEIGEKILVERCVFKIPACLEGKEKFEEVARQFTLLPVSVQTAVKSLHQGSVNPEDAFLVRLFGDGILQFKYNSFGVGLGFESGGICVTASRFNHSCLPNCTHSFVPDHGLMVIGANQTIPVGAELTVTYTNAENHTEGFEAFQAHLRATWGFTCSCRACRDPVVFDKLAQYFRMDEEIMKLGSNGRCRDAYMVGQRRISLIDEVGIYFQKHRTYYHMFRFAVTSHKSLHLAKECLQKALESWLLSIGGSNKECEFLATFRKLVSNPENHKFYLCAEGTPAAWAL